MYFSFAFLMSAVLCIINNDEDCVIIPEKTCRSCLQRKMHMFILREITVSNEFLSKRKKVDCRQVMSLSM